jgi:uncharacterized protein YggE
MKKSSVRLVVAGPSSVLVEKAREAAVSGAHEHTHLLLSTFNLAPANPLAARRRRVPNRLWPGTLATG